MMQTPLPLAAFITASSRSRILFFARRVKDPISHRSNMGNLFRPLRPRSDAFVPAEPVAAENPTTGNQQNK